MAVRFVVRARDGQKLAEELAFPFGEFEHARIILGRAASADVRIPSLTVSESHASVQLRGSEWLLTDLGSRNGTKHNGQRMLPERPRRLSDGDVVEIGDHVLSFHTGVFMTEPMSAERTASLARRLWREAQSARGVQLEAAHVRVVNGARAGTKLEIPAAPARLLIGSQETCQLRLPEPALQRDTLELVHDLEGVLIRSLAGEAVIQLGGQRYKTRRLHHRDELQVGDTRLLFQEPAQHAIDALKGLPDAPLEVKPTAPADSASTPDATATDAQPGGLSAPPSSDDSRAKRSGPGLAELVIYALAIAVLLASGLALTLLLRAR